MKRGTILYDKKKDILYIFIRPGIEEKYEEITPDINLEMGKNGELLGIEIFNASNVLGSKLGIRKPSESFQSVAIPHKIR